MCTSAWLQRDCASPKQTTCWRRINTTNCVWKKKTAAFIWIAWIDQCTVTHSENAGRPYSARGSWTTRSVFNLHPENRHTQPNAQDPWGYVIFKKLKKLHQRAHQAFGRTLKQHMVVTIVDAAQDLGFISAAGCFKSHLSNAGIGVFPINAAPWLVLTLL